MQRAAVVTGASSGIGHALAKELAREGYAVGLTARRGDHLEELRVEIESAGGRAAVAPADATDREAMIAAVHALADALGPIDLLVANAGADVSEPVTRPNAADYETMVRVNVLGPYYAFEAVVPAMIERGSGHLVAVSSIAGYITGPGAGQYSATKAALSMWMEATRLELRGTGIHCTTINPGFVKTAMTDPNVFKMPFLMDPTRAARSIARAIRRKKKVHTFPLQLLIAAKILRLLPDWAKVRLAPEGRPASDDNTDDAE